MSSPIYGLMAEFENPEQLVKATERAYEAGYRKMDAYTPFPVEGAAEAMHFHNTGVPPIVLVGGLVGAFSGFLIQVIGSAYDYPLNVGGRPLYSWPAFIPVTFEAGILIAAFAAVIAMIVLNGLPRPYHPVFNAPNFERVSEDRFFLCIEAKDPQFEQASTRAFLESLGPQQVSEVER
jgi:hypothetical protein